MRHYWYNNYLCRSGPQNTLDRDVAHSSSDGDIAHCPAKRIPSSIGIQSSLNVILEVWKCAFGVPNHSFQYPWNILELIPGLSRDLRQLPDIHRRFAKLLTDPSRCNGKRNPPARVSSEFTCEAVTSHLDLACFGLVFSEVPIPAFKGIGFRAAWIPSRTKSTEQFSRKLGRGKDVTPSS